MGFGQQLWTRSRCPRGLRLVVLWRPGSCTRGIQRQYSTHNSLNMDFGNTNSSLLKGVSSAGRASEHKHDHVGPFQLGLSPSALRQGEKIPKWSELSVRDKVIRSTARTTNFGVILLGAGLSVLLIYSLTSELFSKNSPTVLYGSACERIRQSERLANYLNAPLTFHNNPPSSIRPRHRNRHVTSRVMVDQYGQEHMVMTFYVQGTPEGETTPPSEASYLDSVRMWIHDKADVLSDCSFDDAFEWSREAGRNVRDKSIAAFRYLSGNPLPPPPTSPFPPIQYEKAKVHESNAWSFAGIFSSLKRTRTSSSEPSSKPRGKKFTEGEVHADLVKNKDGYFVFRYLLIDIPSSRDHNPIRVFIERDPSVREAEPVSRWSLS